MKTAEKAIVRRFFGYAVSSALLASSVLTLFGQTAVNVKAQTRNVDFTAAPFTRPVKTGTTLPATCSVGDLFFNTSAPSGQNLFGCPVANSWAALNSGASSGLNDPGANGLVSRTGPNTTTVVGTASAPLQAQNIESVFYADQFPSVQAAITAAGTTGIVVIPASYARTDTWTNSSSVRVLDYRPSAETVYNVRNWGCKGDGATDDTACLTAFFTFINTKNQAVAYFPAGKYLMNGTLRSSSTIWLRGDGYDQTFLVETNPTTDLLKVTGTTSAAGGWSGGVIVSDLALAGEGATTTGNLLINTTNGRAVFQNLAFIGHGGRGILIESERGYYTNIHFSHVRQAIATTANTAINESYLRNFTIMSPGLAMNDMGIGPAANHCYNVNSDANGNYPSSGAVTQDPHFAIDLNADITNFEIANGSIKPTTCIGGIRVRASSVMSVEHVYIEGYTNGSANPSIAYGGNHEKSPLTNAITATQTSFDIADGEWFDPFVGSASDLQNGAAAYVIRPPDYLQGSSAASTLGNGITRGSFEYVTFQGIVHDTATSGWHAFVTARGSSSTTALAWPAGAIFEDGWGSAADTATLLYPGPLRLLDNHLNSVASLNGYTVTCDAEHEKTCGEMVVGVEPDEFYQPGSPNLRQFGLGVRFDGTNQMFCNASVGGFIDTFYTVALDFRGTEGEGPVLDLGGDFSSTTSLSAAVVGSCSIIRHIFANGWGTVLTYWDPATYLYTWGSASVGWTGYSLSAFNAATGRQPTMFVPQANTFHISGFGSATPLPWDWSFNGGIQQSVNGTSLFGIDGSGNVSTPGSSKSARQMVQVNTLTFSATPQFDTSKGDQALTLTANVTASTVANVVAGQRVTFRICQDATGGRTFVWPSVVHGAATVGSTPSTCTVQQFESFDGSTLNATGPAVTNQ